MHETRGEFDWFDILIYGPIHVLGDFTVSFEHCEFSKFADVISDIGSLDWGLIADRGVALGMDVGLNWQVYYDTAMRALGWYTPPYPKECNPDDFTKDDTLNEKAFEKCLTIENDKLKEIEEYLSVIDYCILKHANDLLEAELLEEELAKASIPNLNSEQKGDNKNDKAGNSDDQDFRAKLKQNEFDDDFDEEDDEGETIISALTGFKSNPKKDDLCDNKYGKIAETNFYDLGLFGGKVVSKIFAQQTIS